MYKMFILFVLFIVTTSHSLCSVSHKQLVISVEEHTPDTTYYYNTEKVCFDGNKFFVDGEEFLSHAFPSSELKTIKKLKDALIFVHEEYTTYIMKDKIGFIAHGRGSYYHELQYFIFE